MSAKVISEVCPSYKVLGPSKLNDYRLAFTRLSKKYGAGVADILPTKNLIVYGVLYEIDENEVANLDRKEDFGKSYKRIYVNVVLEDRNIYKAITYTIISKALIEIQPSTEYLDTILQGAKDHNLKESYVSFLKSLKTDENRWSQKGFLVFPTEHRYKAKGMNLLKLSKSVKKKLGLRSFAAVIYGNKNCLVKVDISDCLDEKTCQIDQTVRKVLGIPDKECYGFYVSIFPVKGKELTFPFVRPRSLTLSLEKPSVFHSEKKICVIHRDNISLLGLNEGDYMKIRAVVLNRNNKYYIRRHTLRGFSGTERKIKKEKRRITYPKKSKIYIDLDGRLKLRIPKNFIGTPIVISANVWRLFASRLLYYGITLFLGMVALTPLVQEIIGLSQKSSFAMALLFSVVITILLCIFDVRGKVQY